MCYYILDEPNPLADAMTAAVSSVTRHVAPHKNKPKPCSAPETASNADDADSDLASDIEAAVPLVTGDAAPASALIAAAEEVPKEDDEDSNPLADAMTAAVGVVCSDVEHHVSDGATRVVGSMVTYIISPADLS